MSLTARVEEDLEWTGFLKRVLLKVAELLSSLSPCPKRAGCVHEHVILYTFVGNAIFSGAIPTYVVLPYSMI